MSNRTQAIAGSPDAAVAAPTAGGEAAAVIVDDSPAMFESADEADGVGKRSEKEASMKNATTVESKITDDTQNIEKKASGAQAKELSLRERELVLRAKQLKLAQREKEIAEEKTRLMEKQLELEERLAARFGGAQNSIPAPEKVPLVDKENLMKAALDSESKSAFVKDIVDAAQKMQQNAQDTQVDLVSRVHSLEEKVNQAHLVRLGLVPPVPPAMFASGNTNPQSGTSGSSYDENMFSSSYFPTQKAQAALYSAKAISAIPKLEVRKYLLPLSIQNLPSRQHHPCSILLLTSCFLFCTNAISSLNDQVFKALLSNKGKPDLNET